MIARLFIHSSTFTAESEIITENTGPSDWKRIYVTFTAPASVGVSLCLSLGKGATGKVYFDCVQFEKGGLSDYNLVDNGGFESSPAGYAWTKSGGTSGTEQTRSSA